MHTFKEIFLNKNNLNCDPRLGKINLLQNFKTFMILIIYSNI